MRSIQFERGIDLREIGARSHPSDASHRIHTHVVDPAYIYHHFVIDGVTRGVVPARAADRLQTHVFRERDGANHVGKSLAIDDELREVLERVHADVVRPTG